jgi:hypothetical protein
MFSARRQLAFVLSSRVESSSKDVAKDSSDTASKSHVVGRSLWGEKTKPDMEGASRASVEVRHCLE